MWECRPLQWHSDRVWHPTCNSHTLLRSMPIRMHHGLGLGAQLSGCQPSHRLAFCYHATETMYGQGELTLPTTPAVHSCMQLLQHNAMRYAFSQGLASHAFGCTIWL